MEEWKEINGFNGYYISNYGNIKSIDRTIKTKNGKLRKYKGKLLHLSLNQNGYLLAGLSINHKTHPVYPHKLVAENFLEKPNTSKKLIVNHKDGNKTNNKFDNLEWVSYSENSLHSYYNLKQKRPHSSGYSNEIIKISNNKYIFFSSITEAANSCKISKAQIIRLLNTDKKDLSQNKYITFTWDLYEKIENKEDVFKRKHGLPKQVLLIKNNEIIKIFSSIKEASKYFNKSEYIISKLITNKTYIDEIFFMKFISVEDIEMIQTFVSK